MVDPKRGEIWLVDFEPSQGSETDKTRPALVVNEDGLSPLALRIVVPLTDWKEWYTEPPWIVEFGPTPENGLNKRSGADCFQVRSVSTTRFEKKNGVAAPALIEEVAAGILLCVGYVPPWEGL
jgi:mRNA interferase MazF